MNSDLRSSLDKLTGEEYQEVLRYISTKEQAIVAIPGDITSYLRYYTNVLSKLSGVAPELILSTQRNLPLCWMRYMIMKKLHKDGFTISSIAKAIGRTHSTVIKGLFNMDTLIDYSFMLPKQAELWVLFNETID